MNEYRAEIKKGSQKDNDYFGVYRQYIKDISIINPNGVEYTILYEHDNPTCNCQFGSIGNFAPLLYLNTPRENKIAILRQLWEFKRNKTDMMMVDISQGYEKNFDELIPKENIVFKTKYDSTNGSKMMIIMFKTVNVFYV